MYFKKLSKKATTPRRSTPGSAGLDLYATEDVFILAGETKKIHTDIAVEIPYGGVGLIFARSGLATNSGIRPANCVGVIDSDYRGEVVVPLHNDSQNPYLISADERVAQLIVTMCIMEDCIVAERLSETMRDIGGFGSTGK